MKRIVIPLTAMISGFWLTSAAALGLGDIEVRSHLNQRFDAVIPLTAVGVDEAGDVRVSLAKGDEFSRAGIEQSDYLSSLHFAVKTDGTPRIEITSEQAAREPYVQLLLEVRAGGSRILRQYTVLLDPPGFSAQESAARSNKPVPIVDAQPAQATALPPPSEPAPAPAKPARVAPAPAPASKPAERAPAATMGEAISASAGELYGPVKPAETLWSIATRMRPGADVTMDQVLLAIYNGNPRAFDGGIDGLLKGAMLRVPSRADMTATSVADARAEVGRLRGLTGGAPAATPRPRRPVIEPARIAPPPPAAATAAAPVQPPPAEAAPATPAPKVEAPAAAPSPDNAAAPATATPPSNGPEATPAPAPAPAAGAESPAAEPAPPPPADKPAAKAPPAPAREESGLLETLLLPLILGLLILGAIGYLFSRWRQRRSAAKPGPAAGRPVSAAGPRKMPLNSPSAGKMAAAGVAGAAAAAAGTKLTPREELARLESTLDEPASAADVPTQQLSTQQLDTEADAPASTPAASAADLPPVDFDLTGQFATQTVQIDLDANDPVSEADFHLAYGLYDEAALLLTQAAAREPERTDIGIKLAETYFAAGKVEEFEQTAAALKPRLPASEWHKLAIMGQQLNPSSSLYGDSGASSLAAADLDLSFETPDASTPTPAPAAPVADDNGLDFQLDDFELPSLEADKPGAPGATPVDPAAVEFDLGDFDMGEPPAAPPAPAAPTSSDANASVEFDLGSFDVEPTPSTVPAAPAPADVAAASPAPTDAAEATGEFRLEEFDFDAVPTDSGEISGDEAGTKLDLARAYVDMGDNEMARSLLNEVLQQGNAQQQQDAQALIGRLG